MRPARVGGDGSDAVAPPRRLRQPRLEKRAPSPPRAMINRRVRSDFHEIVRPPTPYRKPLEYDASLCQRSPGADMPWAVSLNAVSRGRNAPRHPRVR